MQPQFLVRHFPAPKLQLHANLVSAIEEFFAVTHFCQVIVLVDVHPEFEFFQPSPCWSPVPLVFGNVVSEFSERDDFADRRIRRGRNLHQIKAEALRFAQGIGQFQDAQLFACGTKDDPDFAGANPTVYAKLMLQFNSISLPPGRECAVTPYFPGSQSPDSTVASLAGTLWHRRSCD